MISIINNMHWFHILLAFYLPKTSRYHHIFNLEFTNGLLNLIEALLGRFVKTEIGCGHGLYMFD